MLITIKTIRRPRNAGPMRAALTSPEKLFPGELLQLECWTCGTHRRVDERPYVAGRIFRLQRAAADIRWIARVCFRRGSWLVFCSDECCKAAQTRQGLFHHKRPR